MFSNNSKYFFYLIVLLGFGLITLSNPFLHFPYDAIAHLIAIDEMYHGGTTTSTSIPRARLLWHSIWANIFILFHIDSTQLLLRAKIIHVVQMGITLFSVYYFSHVLIRNIFKKINKQTLQYLSLWSVLIWLSIFATFSVHYQLVWSLWYSVNYQITLAFFWYITALTMVLFLEHTSTQKKLFFIFQIILLSMFILRVHAMEFMYYLMYLSVFTLIYIDKVSLTLKKYYYILIPLLAVIVYFILNYQSEDSKFLSYLTIEKIPSFYERVIWTGHVITTQLNRSYASINELMYLIYYMSIVVFFIFIWHWYRNKQYVNPRIFIFLFITALFVTIPLYDFTAGLFGLITRNNVIHRMYYSSSIFVLLPILVYYVSQMYNLNLKYTNLLLFLCIVSALLVSKHTNLMNHTYYKNIKSIKNSFSLEKNQFHLTQDNIDYIGKKLDEYEKNSLSNKRIFCYARADIAFVIKYVYGKKAYWLGRRTNPNYKKLYELEKHYTKYHMVLFETPETFPDYVPYQ